MEIDIRRSGIEVLSQLEPLWLSLQRHHAEVAPQLGAIRSTADSWSMRSADYKKWLAAGDSFIAVAELQSQLIAYAFVRLRENRSDTWQVHEQVGEIETLCVLPDFRGQGLGEKLLGFVYSELQETGVQQVSLAVIASNSDAIRFYESQGFEPKLVSMTKKLH